VRRQPNRWLILSLGLAAQTATSAYLYGLPMLLPQLRQEDQLSLAAAGWVVAAPSLGLLATLILWGAAADRRGERGVMALGLALAGGFLVVAALVHGAFPRLALLALAGAGGASVNAASGRVVLGWFASHERGTAMGVRQTAQPLGVALAALTFPPIADAAGVGWALALPAVLCLLISGLVLAFVVDPPRDPLVSATSSGSPYGVPTLWRLHASSALLIVPQFAISVFALEFLVTQRGWAPVDAGRLLFGFQIMGAVGRLAAGRWSDVVGSRLRPMRVIAVAAAVTMLAMALGAGTGSVIAVVAVGIGTVVSVADNGLGFTAVAELAGSQWAGRAMGVQNTSQNVIATLTPALLGGLIASAGFSVGFAVVAVFPLLAVLATPVAAETLRVPIGRSGADGVDPAINVDDRAGRRREPVTEQRDAGTSGGRAVVDVPAERRAFLPHLLETVEAGDRLGRHGA
jgi:sugar phosphate permease